MLPEGNYILFWSVGGRLSDFMDENCTTANAFKFCCGRGKWRRTLNSLGRIPFWNGGNGIKSRQSNVKNQEVGKQHGCQLHIFFA